MPNPFDCLLAIPICVDVLTLPVTLTLEVVDHLDEEPVADDTLSKGGAVHAPKGLQSSRPGSTNP